MATIRTIESYNTHQRYSVDFFGDEIIVTVTDTPSVIIQWIRNVLSHHHRVYSHTLVVGVGVQWTPFSSCSYPPADILQLCVGNRCIIIQLGYCNFIPNELRDFLTDEETTFVGIWNSQDRRRLSQSRHQLWIRKLLDIRMHVTDKWGRDMTRCSFQEIVEECMGYEGVALDRDISMSDWGVHELDLDQIRQASVKAFVCSKLGVWARLWDV